MFFKGYRRKKIIRIITRFACVAWMIKDKSKASMITECQAVAGDIMNVRDSRELMNEAALLVVQHKIKVNEIFPYLHGVPAWNPKSTVQEVVQYLADIVEKNNVMIWDEYQETFLRQPETGWDSLTDAAKILLILFAVACVCVWFF